MFLIALRQKRHWAIGTCIGLVLGLAVTSPLLWRTSLAQSPLTPVIALDCAGFEVNYFTDIEGLGTSSEVVIHKVVNDQGREFQIKLPGRLDWHDIILRREVTANGTLWQWREVVINGDIETARRSCAILLLDRNLSPVVQWNLERVWPSGLSAKSVPSADGSSAMIEELVLTHEYIVRSRDLSNVDATRYLPLIQK